MTCPLNLKTTPRILSATYHAVKSKSRSRLAVFWADIRHKHLDFIPVEEPYFYLIFSNKTTLAATDAANMF